METSTQQNECNVFLPFYFVAQMGLYSVVYSNFNSSINKALSYVKSQISIFLESSVLFESKLSKRHELHEF